MSLNNQLRILVVSLVVVGCYFLTKKDVTEAQTNNGIVYVTTAPSGAVSCRAPLRLLVPTGSLYSPQGMTTCSWGLVGPGGGGGVTSVATTAPIAGGTITTTGTITCATCVVASSPGVGLAHFAGSTQTVTSSLVVNADITTATIAPNKMSAGTFTTLTDGATVTWAIGSVLNQSATLLFTTDGGSRTLNITGPVINGNYVVRITQDGTGGEGLILGTGCTWKVINTGAGAVTLSTGANAVDILSFIYDGANCLANLGKDYS